MLQSLMLRQLGSEEKKLGVSVDYMRHVLRAAPGVFYRFLGVLPLSKYRRAIPPDAMHVARLVVTRAHDCGTCLQIEANLARQDGVSVEIVQAVLDDKPQALPKPLREVYEFADKVARATYDEAALREALRARYGEKALVELSMHMALCGVFPVLKRALGYAVSCQRVQVVA